MGLTRGRCRRPPHPPAPGATGSGMGRRHAGRGLEMRVAKAVSPLPVFLRKEETHILQRLAGRGQTIASYLRDFLSPFTPFLLCYSLETRMVTMKPLRSKLSCGCPTTAPSATSLPAGRRPQRPRAPISSLISHLSSLVKVRLPCYIIDLQYCAKILEVG